MFFQILFFWLLLLLYLVPLLIVGIIVLRKASLIDRFEILMPAGCILGISIFTFFINLFSFVKPGKPAVYIAYLSVLVSGLLAYKIKIKSSDISFPSKKSLLFYLISMLLWGTFIFWKGGNALIGSDTNLYYSIAHTFLKGNFPPMTPWQPDLPLSYHLGSSELLAAFYQFTNLSFVFLHIFFSSFFIFLSSQIIIWIWKRHGSATSFILANLYTAMILISFGFFKLIIPQFPLQFPRVANWHQLFFWIRDLPTVNQSIEVYGAPVNLDGLIYFIFHSYGLTLALSLIVLMIYQKHNKPILGWILLGLGLASMALVNESIFIFLTPAMIIGQLILEISNKTFKKNFIAMIITLVTVVLVILAQGGIITNTLFKNVSSETSILFFPGKQDSKEDFVTYHYNQEISKILPTQKEWLPFRWFSVGIEILFFIPVIALFFIKNSKEKFLVLIFFMSGLFSLVAYNFIVPKFLAANGNRFLAFSFIFSSLATLFSFQFLIDFAPKKNLFKSLILTIIMIFIILPTILPSFLLLSKNRFSENKLLPRPEQATEAVKWIEHNISVDQRFIVLDVRAPHPSGQSRIMVQAGVFAPVFPGGVRTYTIEASPEYLDIAYTLSPKALKELKINYLLIDSSFFTKLPELRKKQLEEGKFFKKVFVNENANSWEKIFEIDKSFFDNQNELPGTIREMSEKITNGKIYIDNEEYFNPSFLRRAIIFSLRQKDLYFLPQSGVYLNVEAGIRQSYPIGNDSYDYLVLGKDRDPKEVCQCQTKLIWQSFSGEIYLWKRV